ncbi:MAG TPA: MBOAT family O-acyltransferase [Rhodanobacter sp.]|nr:MBOAT family O-acyltransferase [Acetobacteraceae bacterium]HVC16038.1 MBOAT family O-acyltransferase [Rhodanobacter sp.]
MIYSTYAFLLLLPPLVVWFYSLRSILTQNLLLLGASLVFLAWTNVWNLAPALLVVAGVWLWFHIDARWRLSWRPAGVVISLLVLQLAYLKYRSFIAETFGVSLPVPAVLTGLIPLGISFYSFEAISAVVDVKRRPVKLAPMSWSLFILFLPHLIAGPIVRLRQLVPQFEQTRKFRWRSLSVGLHFFTIGFAKKLAADPLGRIVDPVWSAPGQASSVALLLALLGFSAQLYLDFSGYTDMGRGIARMLGFRLPLNFRAPFFAHTPSEFYRRWHVSLSNWIRVFVYDTLAVAVFRRVRGRRRQNRALFAVILLVMAIFGLWHGSAWHFVLFGVAQGLVIAGWAAVTKGRAPRSRAGWLASLLILQASWLFSLVLFRADSLSAASQVLVGLADGGHWFSPGLLWCPVAMAAAVAVQAVEYYVRRRPVARALRWLRGSALGGTLMLAGFAGAFAIKVWVDARAIAATGVGMPAASFIYFRF